MSGTTLGIAGVGLIGGSIALRARAGGMTVVGYDRDDASLREAGAAGALDAIASSLAELATRCDVLAIALPVDATIAALNDASALAGPRLVFDVASVKGPIVRAAADLATFVATHPLAGRETGGFAAADANLFEGRPWAVVPAANAAAETELTAFVRRLGARPVRIAAADHDRIVAATSHLPQAVSVALAALLSDRIAADPRTVDLCGPGIASMLRLAHSPALVWEPIVTANAARIAAELRALVGFLETAAAELETGEVAALMSYFERGRRALEAVERSEISGRSLPDAASRRVT